MSKLKDEIDRQYRVIDMMISMHSLARDDKKLKSKTLDVTLLLFSVITCALLLSEYTISTILPVNENFVEICTALFSMIVFFLSLLEYKLGWKEERVLHDSAVKKLSLLKTRYRQVYISGTINFNLNRLFNSVMKSIHPIPEKDFLKYKAKHLYKIEVSKALSGNPGISIILLRLKIKLGLYN